MKVDISPTGRRLREALRIMALLEKAGHAARLAGGCVRDRLLGRTPADFDVATSAPPELVTELMRKERLKVVPTGIDHGTVTVVMAAGPVEVTTLRRDVATDGRHAVVAFGSSFEEDAERRDFTINALFEDGEGQIFDYFGGRADLAAGILRFVGDPPQRIAEDYLRIMRCFRFQARFGYELAPGTLAAIAAATSGLSRVSQERISAELWKTLAGPYLATALTAMRQTGVWQHILPELADRPLLDQAFIAKAVGQFAQSAEAERAAALFSLHAVADDGAAAPLAAEAMSALATRLRLPGLEINRLAMSCKLLPLITALGPQTADELDVIDALEAGGGEGAWMRFYLPLAKLLAERTADPLRRAHVEAAITRLERAEWTHKARRIAKLPVDGKSLMQACGLTAGPELGRILALLKRQFRNGSWSTREEGLDAASRLLAAGAPGGEDGSNT